MNGIGDFITLLRDELGIPVEEADVHRDLDEVAGWDSVHLLVVLSSLERVTGRRMSLPHALEARTLDRLYALTVSA
ncbi:acyl carrier protein [Amycolatopsis sp., V23-08]|uniref:Acyl carrier protein n=1 Tax=Amycolatopsis heterodermiae TaxID=3110235 RepID=A0ABU5R3E9_9PSEU|nr:acyl carrier protein [Amycolatopsis sp., V23-08]MEA5360359.1 acyl carrier protein [Amycolatopsis sp., V23-08]